MSHRPRSFGLPVVTALALALVACSDDSSTSAPASTSAVGSVLAACEQQGGTLSYVQGDDWTCDQIPVDSDARYGELTEFFTPLCANPNVVTSGWFDEAQTIAGWSCSPEPDESAGFATLEEACASVGGVGSVGDVEGWWWCENVPVASDAEYAAAEAAVAPFCSSPYVFRSEPMDDQGNVMMWWCEGVVDEEVPTVDNVCAQIAGEFIVRDDGGWTCDNVSINAPSDYDAVTNVFTPYCPAPFELSYGMRTQTPETAGWSCSSPTAEAAAASIEEACALVVGTLTPIDGGGWSCSEIDLGTLENYEVVENLLAPFCVAPLQLTSGMLDDDPPIAGWSCSPA